MRILRKPSPTAHGLGERALAPPSDDAEGVRSLRGVVEIPAPGLTVQRDAIETPGSAEAALAMRPQRL